MTSPKIQTVFVTFGAGRTGWYQAAKRISKQAQATGIFPEVITLNESWLKEYDPEAFEIVKKFHSRKMYKGFGFMVWKPVILKWAYQQYPKSNILYIDSGSQIDQSKNHIETFNELLIKHDQYGLAWQLPNHMEISWSKNELIARLSPPEKILQTGQVQSGFIFITRNKLSDELIHNWYQVGMERDGFYFSDELEINQNGSFIAHRHDQSAFSLLWKMLGLGVAEDMTHPGNLGNFPVVAMRNNTPFSADTNQKLLAAMRNLNALTDKILNRG
jgi:hypothetical protein